MTAQNQKRSWGLSVLIIVIGALFALLAFQFVGLLVATMVLMAALTLGAYAYAGWERAWAVGLAGSFVVAFVVGATLITAGGWVLAGLLALSPAVVAAWMMFGASSQLLIVWRGGNPSDAFPLMSGFLVSTMGRFQGLLPGPSQSFFSIQVISKGEMTYSRPPSRSIRMLGPGMIIVDSGNAVVLEKNGQITRVEGSGFIKTQPYEVLSAIVDLRLQKKTLAPTADTLTRDGIPLQVTCTILYRIVCDEKALIDEAKYCFDEKAIRRAVLWAADWKEQTELAARTVLRDNIAERQLNEIIYQPRGRDLDEAPPSRVHLQERIRREVDRRSREWGVTIVTVMLDEIKLPEEAQSRLLRMWLADRDVQIAESEKLTSVTQGEAEMARLRLREVTRAEAQTRMMAAITEGIRQIREHGGDPQELIAMRFIEALEKMAEDPATKMFLPNSISEMLQQFGKSTTEP
jgi:regulator of protease activity HflC (stomatin/prohibitin superfamily)